MLHLGGHPGAGTELRNIREALGPDNQRKIAAVIGPEAADSYIGALQQEEHMHFAPNRLTKGSDTGQNLAYQRLLQPPGTPGLWSRAVDVAGWATHPKAKAAEAAREAIARGEEARAGREAQRWQQIRADLGRLLTTQGPERDAIKREIVRRIQENPQRARGGRVDARGLPMTTRKQSAYAPDRGKPDHHCGPDKQWPHGFCAKFRGPHACAEVAGFIARKGGCDWFQPADHGEREERASGGRVDDERQERKFGGAAPGPAPAEPPAFGKYKNYHDFMSEMGAQSGAMAQSSMRSPAPVPVRPSIPISPETQTASQFLHVQNPHAPTQRADGGAVSDKRHVRVHGLDIIVEHDKGSTSRGVTIPFGYGYTRNAAGERVDAMLGPHLKSDKIFVVAQQGMGPGAMIGFGSAAQARSHYLRAFPDGGGKKKLRGIAEMSVEQFRKWLTKPAAKAA
jgi:hypothetical protein